ncbi:MAG: bifunctional serine/threonine-protein kinase/formylglycine-generating enzyme family protein, partial [Myxococcota bacterium]|nr:bifunctional serine/threonine-protein kinase/formylglycine-generating enzyme family protein [Myxococcota bacterium]
MSKDDSTIRQRLAELVREAEESVADAPPLAVDILSASGLGVDSEQSVIEPGPIDLGDPEAFTETGRSGVPLASRYQAMELLGEGGMGEVHLAYDRNLGREVALKMIPPERVNRRRLARFVTEARITAQLEHPGIVPVHDLFVSPTGDVYYTMKRVQGRTLRDSINDLRSAEPRSVARYTPGALIGIFRSACQAVAYAHKRRVIHRDLKPDNIMIGDFGEVLLMDWGVARSLDSEPEKLLPVPASEGVTLQTTADGAMVGSPAYMAPEGLQGEMESVDARSDVFSLGIILYELLTLERPFQADNLGRLMYLVVQGDFLPPSEHSPDRDIPAEIEATCLKALSPDPNDRFRDAGELALVLAEWLEGVGPRQEAERLVRHGRSLRKVYAAHAAEAEEGLLLATTLQAGLKPWDPLEMKRLAWEARKNYDDAVAAADRVFGDCEAAFESALSHVGGYRPAREGLADLYWLRFLEAEEARDPRWRRRWEELVRRYAPEAYADWLDGEGSLRVLASPATTTVSLHPMVDRDGRLVKVEGQSIELELGSPLPLAMGTYTLRLSAPGHASLEAPVLIQRLQNVEVRFDLPETLEVPDGFVPIPGGSVVLGGDPDALSGFPETVAHLNSFALARHPVTVAEYLRFLLVLHERDPALALARAPRRRGSEAAGSPPLFPPSPGEDVTFPVE